MATIGGCGGEEVVGPTKKGGTSGGEEGAAARCVDEPGW